MAICFLIFCGAVLVSDMVISRALFRFGASDYDRTVAGIYDLDQRLDVLFLGTSHTYSSVNPAAFDAIGLDIYCLTLPSSGPRTLNVALQTFLLNNPAPKLVVVEASYFSLSDLADRTPEFLTLDYDTARRFQILFDSGEKSKAFASLSGTWANRRLFRPAVRRILLGDTDPIEWDRGFLATVGELDPEDTRYFEHLDFSKETSLMTAKVASLRSMLKSLRDRGIRIAIIDPPEYASATEVEIQPLRVEFEDLLDSLAQEFECPVLEYSAPRYDAIRSDPKFFRNGDHLNLAGANRFSPGLARQVAQLLEDRAEPDSPVPVHTQ